MSTFFTARTVGADGESLLQFRAGAAWVYTDAPETFLAVTRAHAQIVARVLATQPICLHSYLCTLCHQERELKKYEREYIGYVANLTCSFGEAEKLLCQASTGVQYFCYVSRQRA